MRLTTRIRKRQGGTTLIEVLVALVITVIGLLGLIGLQMRAYGAENESYQRAQAAILVSDMVSRIQANPAAALTYVGTHGTGAVQSCNGTAGTATRDLCEWGNLIRGAAESLGGGNVGAVMNGVGCITTPAANVYIVAVAWQGTMDSAPPASTCGSAQIADPALRRAVTGIIQIPVLE